MVLTSMDILQQHAKLLARIGMVTCTNTLLSRTMGGVLVIMIGTMLQNMGRNHAAKQAAIL